MKRQHCAALPEAVDRVMAFQHMSGTRAGDFAEAWWK